ncbi:hypothetical protein GGS23DRAFT_551004 [Durotheca rogersii]|uniref:uncharacterized protein n=1 Tax=Durotheca rogersii TaxID=419775 RepID=UPI00221FB775|nr:uncharacterized protein GGS23DRAFT_551004 [Durotheca rogersii]KAI5866529.1 hypothetical protein GGS23DRAFT_551004 [Durotheca rogersii]
MRFSALFLTSLATVALAAPVEVPSGLSERQYARSGLYIGADDAVKRSQYRPKSFRLSEGEDAVEKRQYPAVVHWPNGAEGGAVRKSEGEVAVVDRN